MGVPKQVAVAVSGLVFAGAAALAIGTAPSAGAQTVTAAPQWGGRSCGCGGGGGCCSRNHHHFRNWHSNNYRHHQRVIVINRNHNFGRSESGQAQRHQQRQFMEERRPVFQQPMILQREEPRRDED